MALWLSVWGKNRIDHMERTMILGTPVTRSTAATVSVTSIPDGLTAR